MVHFCFLLSSIVVVVVGWHHLDALSQSSSLPSVSQLVSLARLALPSQWRWQTNSFWMYRMCLQHSESTAGSHLHDSGIPRPQFIHICHAKITGSGSLTAPGGKDLSVHLRCFFQVDRSFHVKTNVSMACHSSISSLDSIRQLE